MHKQILSITLLALIFLSSCTSLDLAMDHLPVLKNSELLFKDDFHDSSSGWTTNETEIDLKGYSPEGFLIVVNLPNTKSWSVPGMIFADVEVSVKAQKITGPENNLHGVICRYLNEENYYSFLIGNDGYYGISKTVNGQEAMLGRPVMDFSFDINQKDERNEITVGCVGSNLTLTVNGIELLKVKDHDLPYGEVGLIVVSREQPGVAILFNDFSVFNR